MIFLSLSLCSYARDRSVTKPWHRAYIHGPDEVIIQHPSMSYSDLKDPSGYERGRVAANQEHERHSEAETVLRNAILADEERQLTTVCFKFPFPLDNEVFCPGATDQRIAVRLIPDKPSDKKIPPVRVKVFFAIAKYDPNPPRIAAPAVAQSVNECADMMDHILNLSGGGNNNGMN